MGADIIDNLNGVEAINLFVNPTELKGICREVRGRASKKAVWNRGT